MIKYLEEVLGLECNLRKWEYQNKLPLFLKVKREYFEMVIYDIKYIVVKENDDNFNIQSFENILVQLSKYTDHNIVFWLESISSYQRKALISNHISFVVPNNQLYIPSIGICLKEYFNKKNVTKNKLSSYSQLTLLYLMYNPQIKSINQTELSKMLKTSTMNISRAVYELKDLELINIESRGREKYIQPNKVGKELYKEALKYMDSPIQKKIHVAKKENLDYLLVSGEEALSKISMLNTPKVTVRAIDKKSGNNLFVEKEIEPSLINNYEYIEVEFWKYDPNLLSENGIVDLISLSLCFKNSKDERIEGELDRIMRENGW